VVQCTERPLTQAPHAFVILFLVYLKSAMVGKGCAVQMCSLQEPYALCPSARHWQLYVLSRRRSCGAATLAVPKELTWMLAGLRVCYRWACDAGSRSDPRSYSLQSWSAQPLSVPEASMSSIVSVSTATSVRQFLGIGAFQKHPCHSSIQDHSGGAPQ
jgi:hypothetical protein